jgi:hypothetical protein
MNDRKHTTFSSEVAVLAQETNELKATQYTGADTRRLYYLASGASSDEAPVITAGNRITRLVSFTPTLDPWQEGHYTQIYAKFWVDNMSNPYEGMLTQPVFVTNPEEYTVGDVAYYFFQVENDDASSHTVYIKYYVVTTTTGGTLNA